MWRQKWEPKLQKVSWCCAKGCVDSDLFDTTATPFLSLQPTAECEEHYFETYINTKTAPLPGMP